MSKEKKKKKTKKAKKGKKHSNARRKKIGGFNFASRAEAYRYVSLMRMVKAQEISNLELQPKFPICVKDDLICTYIADFKYTTKEGEVVVEDVKGRVFPMYRLKLKLFKACYPQLTFYEVRPIRRSKKRKKITWDIQEK